MEIEKLLSCPFCGMSNIGEDVDDEHYCIYYEINCNNCGASSAKRSPDKARSAWNTRMAATEKPDTIEFLKHDIDRQMAINVELLAEVEELRAATRQPVEHPSFEEWYRKEFGEAPDMSCDDTHWIRFGWQAARQLRTTEREYIAPSIMDTHEAVSALARGMDGNYYGSSRKSAQAALEWLLKRFELRKKPPLTKYTTGKETKLYDESLCACDCHEGKSMHFMECCNKCQECGQNIKDGDAYTRSYKAIHENYCPVLHPDGPVEKG